MWEEMLTTMSNKLIKQIQHTTEKPKIHKSQHHEMRHSICLSSPNNIQRHPVVQESLYYQSGQNKQKILCLVKDLEEILTM
jgi:hypothetical protein